MARPLERFRVLVVPEPKVGELEPPVQTDLFEHFGISVEAVASPRPRPVTTVHACVGCGWWLSRPEPCPICGSAPA